MGLPAVSQGSILAKVGGGLLIGWAIAAAAPLAAESPAAYLGPSALVASKDGRVLYVACADGKRVILVDIPRRPSFARSTYTMSRPVWPLAPTAGGST